MFKKLLILFVIFMLIFIYHEKIIDQIEIYADDHKESTWAPKVEYMIGNFYYYIHKYDKAIEVYDWILFYYKDSEFTDDAQYMLGHCYEGKGEHDKARVAYKKLIEKYPKSELVKKAQKRMENMDLRLF